MLAASPSPSKRSVVMSDVPLEVSFLLDAATKHASQSPPRRVSAGCDHKPFTCYIPSKRLVYCSMCAAAAVQEIEKLHESPRGIGLTLKEHRWDGIVTASTATHSSTYTQISTLLADAETLLAELAFRQRQASSAMASAPAFSELEHERERLKAEVDATLMAVVRHVDDTRSRLHGDIDRAVAVRADNVTQLVRLKKAADEMLDLFEPALKRSADFDATRALDVLLALEEHVELYDDLARLSAAVAAPFRLSLRSEYAKFDLSALRVINDLDSPSPAPAATTPVRQPNTSREL